MIKKNKIFWISSWPKSGNTLLRTILALLFFTKDGKLNNYDILYNTMQQFEIMQRLDFIKKENPNDYNNLSNIKILSKYWLDMQSKGLNISGDFCFLKTHSALLSMYNNQFTTKENTIGFFYIVRDPRDVAISYSRHMNIDIDTAINKMINDTTFFSYVGKKDLNQKINPLGILSSWKIHLKSWQMFEVPRLILKYEDIVYNKEVVIKKIIDFFKNYFNLKFQNSSNKLNNIINTTSFENMKKLENKKGFKGSVHNLNFFHAGTKLQWKQKLKLSQIKLIEKHFKKEMGDLGYL